MSRSDAVYRHVGRMVGGWVYRYALEVCWRMCWWKPPPYTFLLVLQKDSLLPMRTMSGSDAARSTYYYLSTQVGEWVGRCI